MNRTTHSASDAVWLARDAFYEWRSHVKTAQSRILVLSPYLDDLVRTLLRSSPLDPSCTTVVTNLNPGELSPTLLKQVRTLRKLISDGVEVRHLDRLHAKVLLVDDTSVSIGSQNFTAYARKSRETTAFNSSMSKDADLVRVIYEWIGESAPISEQVLSEIESACEAELKEMGKVAARLSEGIQQILEHHSLTSEQVKAVQFVAELLAAAEEAKNRKKAEAQRFKKLTGFSSGVLPARLRTRGNRVALVPDDNRSYRTIFSEYTWLNHYPIYNLSTRQMGLARVPEKQISIIGSSWYNGNVAIGSRSLKADFLFPSVGFEDSNIHVTLSDSAFNFETFKLESISVTLKILFDDVSFHLVDVESTAEDSLGVIEFFSNPSKLKAFLVRYLRVGRFSYGNLQGDEADAFFERQKRYEIGLSDVTPVPILVVREV